MYRKLIKTLDINLGCVIIACPFIFFMIITVNNTIAYLLFYIYTNLTLITFVFSIFTSGRSIKIWIVWIIWIFWIFWILWIFCIWWCKYKQVNMVLGYLWNSFIKKIQTYECSISWKFDYIFSILYFFRKDKIST